MFEDREITCVDCGQLFVFSAGEQEFYDRKGFKETPKRCKACREVRKQKRAVAPTAPPPRVEVAPPGGLGGRELRDEGGERPAREPRQMFDITCASCGKPARVPFKPMAGRPVFCRDCYAKKAASDRA